MRRLLASIVFFYSYYNVEIKVLQVLIHIMSSSGHLHDKNSACTINGPSKTATIEFFNHELEFVFITSDAS